MTQLIENKPPRLALIATLLRFSPHQPGASSLQHQDPNRQLARLEINLTSAESTNVPVLIANFCDIRTSASVASDRVARITSNRGTRELETLLTLFRINTPASPNRGQFDDPTRIVVLSEQREPKDPLRSHNHLPLACPDAAQQRRAAPFLIDTACRLEINLTPCGINTNSISNRRWIAGFSHRISSCILATERVDTAARRRLTCLRGEILCFQETCR